MKQPNSSVLENVTYQVSICSGTNDVILSLKIIGSLSKCVFETRTANISRARTVLSPRVLYYLSPNGEKILSNVNVVV